MADWIFDGVNKIIKEPGSGPGDSTADANRDIYSAWKRWIKVGDNGKFLPAFSIEGGTPIGATGLFTGTTLILINGWKLQGGDWDHQVLINGNIYSSDGVATVANPSYNANIVINASVAAQGIASGSAVTAQDKTDIIEGVWRYTE